MCNDASAWVISHISYSGANENTALSLCCDGILYKRTISGLNKLQNGKV